MLASVNATMGDYAQLLHHSKLEVGGSMIVADKLEELETDLQTTIEEVKCLQHTVEQLIEVVGLNLTQKEEHPE